MAMNNQGWERNQSQEEFFFEKKKKRGQSTCKNTFYMKRLKTYFKTYNIEYIRIRYH